MTFRTRLHDRRLLIVLQQLFDDFRGGGTLAGLYAGAYPEQVSALILIEGIGLWPSLLADMEVGERIRQWIEGLRQLAGRLPRPESPARGTRLYNRAGGVRSACACGSARLAVNGAPTAPRLDESPMKPDRE